MRLQLPPLLFFAQSGNVQTMIKTSFQFTDILARTPGNSVAGGLRDGKGRDPDPQLFLSQHEQYLAVLQAAGVRVTLLEPLEEFPDSVFVEDAAVCIGKTAVALRPGAPSRFGETAAIRPSLEALFPDVVDLDGSGFLDGGDVLVAEHEIFAGLSGRTNQAGLDAFAEIASDLGYTLRQVNTPSSILHFKTACGLLDEQTIFATRELSASGCFEGYKVIDAIAGEEAAANLIRVNDVVMVSSGLPLTEQRLREHGYQVVAVETSEAAKVDAGLSCMSLRFNLAQH